MMSLVSCQTCALAKPFRRTITNLHLEQKKTVFTAVTCVTSNGMQTDGWTAFQSYNVDIVQLQIC